MARETPSQPNRPPPTPRRRRTLPRWKQVLFRLLAFAIPVLGLEATARVYWTQFVSPPKDDTGLYEEMLGTKVLGDEVPYQFRPNDKFVVATTPTETNNLAIRGSYDVDISQPFLGMRILCLGDSVTFGYTVSGNAAAYPAVLESLLREREVECQVLNAGMPRFRIQHLATMYADHFRHYGADRVIVLAGWNNANDRVLKPSGTGSWMSLLNQHWFTLKVVHEWELLPRFGGKEHPPALIDPAGFDDYGDSVEQLIQMIRASGAEPILCTLPHFFRHVEEPEAIEKAATFTPHGTIEQLAFVADQLNERIRTVASQTHVPVIELGEIDSHRQFGDAIHPNDEGSRAIATLVAEFLLTPSEPK